MRIEAIIFFVSIVAGIAGFFIWINKSEIIDKTPVKEKEFQCVCPIHTLYYSTNSPVSSESSK